MGLLLGEIRGQSLSGHQELLLIDDVVAIEHRPGLVPGEQHGDPFRDARPDQVPRGRATAIMQEPVGHVGLATRVAQRRAPHADGHAVAPEDASIAGATRVRDA